MQNGASGNGVVTKGAWCRSATHLGIHDHARIWLSSGVPQIAKDFYLNQLRGELIGKPKPLAHAGQG